MCARLILIELFAEPCRKLTEAAERAGYPVKIKIYPEAHHSFDSNRPVRCIRERVNQNFATGRGATTGWDPKAWADSIREVDAFFGQHLMLRENWPENRHDTMNTTVQFALAVIDQPPHNAPAVGFEKLTELISNERHQENQRTTQNETAWIEVPTLRWSRLWRRSNPEMGELVSETAAASNEQAQGIDQVNRAVGEMDKVVQQNAANAEESAAASQEMSAQASQMKSYVKDLVAVVGGNEKRHPGAGVVSRQEGWQAATIQ
jgi:hypothetical protein